VIFDPFMQVVQNAGAQAMITVNYGSGSPSEAADWIAYANTHFAGDDWNYIPYYRGVTAGGNAYGIKYWEIGNEVYGDGSFDSTGGTSGQTWEVNRNPIGPSNYANGIIAYSQAMKAVDSTISIGAVLTAPGNWPDSANNPVPNPNNPDGRAGWNQTVLAKACSSLDFVDVHWYPQAPAGSGNGYEDDAQLLKSPESGITDHNRTPSIASMVQTLQKEINQYCGAHASAVKIMVTETNSVYGNPGRQTTSLVNALFLDDDVMTWLDNDVANVDWWAAHNSPFDGSTTDQATGAPLYGSYNFGDFGLLSRGLTSPGGAVEPLDETPFPAYYGMQMLTHFLFEGGSYWGALARTTSSTNMISVHTNSLACGPALYCGVNVLFINKDPANTYNETFSLDGITHGTATVYTYGSTSPNGISQMPSISLPNGSQSFDVTLPPYSIVAVNLPTTNPFI